MKDFTFHIFSTKVDSKEDETNLAKSELALEKIYFTASANFFYKHVCVTSFRFCKKLGNQKLLNILLALSFVTKLNRNQIQW